MTSGNPPAAAQSRQQPLPEPSASSALLAEAVAQHRAGRLAEAAELYARELQARPDNPEALHYFGFLRYQQRAYADAARLIGAAVAVKPDMPEAHNHLGLALQAAGKHDDAIAAYRNALVLKPDYAGAANNLGNALATLRRFGEAIDAYRRAIEHGSALPAVHNNLGNALAMLGRSEEAVAAYRQALALQPNYPEAHNNLGLSLAALGRRDAAAAAYRAALALRPDYVAAQRNLAVALTELGALDAAAPILRPLLDGPGRNDPALHNHFGLVLSRGNRFAEAADAFRRAVALNPNLPEVHNNLGLALAGLGRTEDAITAHRDALFLRPDFPEAHLGLALRLLLQGDLRQGFAEFRWRWKSRAFGPPMPPLTWPQWDGESSLAGKTILVHCEQGFGDCLQFIRYVRPLTALAGHVVVAAFGPLASLFRSIPDIEVIADVIPRDRRFDCHSPLLCLPRVFGTTLDTIPADVPYLSPDAAKVADWAVRLAPDAGNLKVGLVWAGAARDDNPTMRATDRRRSLALADFAPLAGGSGNVRFFSLQKGPAAEQVWAPPLGMADLVDWTGELHDFDDTGALVANLDLVISVDTSVVHLAGALAKPVWVLSRFDGCWRWLRDRDDSPWYPTARIFRQQSPGDWAEVVARVAAALERVAAPRPG